jgi:entericidin B
MEQQVDDYQHECRDAQQPSKHVFTHDCSPVELLNVELSNAEPLLFPHGPNGACGQRGARRYRTVRIAPAMSKLQSADRAVRIKVIVPAMDPRIAISSRLAHAMRISKARASVGKLFSTQNGVMTMMRKLLSAVLLGTFLVGIAGCNTMAGAGKDVQKGGQKLENSAEKNKSK